MASAKYKGFRSNWKNGIVGVDAPCSDQTGEIYRDQLEAMEVAR